MMTSVIFAHKIGNAYTVKVLSKAVAQRCLGLQFYLKRDSNTSFFL